MSFEDPQQPLPRGPTSQPFRGPRRTHRETGRTEVWVEGRGYVPENALDRLPNTEQRAVLEARANAQRLTGFLPDLDRFEELNRTENTGGWNQRLGQFFGDMPEIFPDNGVDEMRSITDRLTPQQRPPGSGTTSDFDAAMFRGSLPHRGRGGNANSQVIANLRRQARDAQEYAEFLDWYWPQGGSTSGATEAWGQYMRQRQPNDTRTWREYFGAQGQQQGGGRTAPQQRSSGRTRYDANGNPIR